MSDEQSRETAARNEQSGPEARAIAGRVLQRGFAWPEEAKTLAASVLAQSPDREEGEG